MKKLGIIMAILAALFILGCASASGKGTIRPYFYDLSKLEFTKNAQAFTKAYDDLLIPLPEPSGVDFTKFRRVTVYVKFFDKNNVEVEPTWDANAMVSLIYDKDVEDSALRNGPNVPLKTFNLGMESISTEAGFIVILDKAPGAILIQNNNINIGYVQLTGLIFHNGNLDQMEESADAGTLEPFSLTLADNFQYGDSYQGKVTKSEMLGGHKIAAGETYTLQITFTTSRDLEDEITVGFVDTSSSANYWKPLSWDASELPPTRIPACKAGQTVSVTLTINTIAGATASAAAANALVFETKGAGEKGTADSGVLKPVNMNFTQFVLTRQ